ncbi:MAG: amidohydrolase family protein [Bryobacteraceae bacterium]|nr:amidohydrolase family protein [Bryobacteraceae bacterium]
MNRRTFLASSVCAAAAAQAPPIPIIDTHIHLYDPTRPEGVPWPPKTSSIHVKTLPSRLREVTRGLGILGAVEVECSPWLEDNQWVLDVAAKDSIIVGMVGNLEPDKPDFKKQLDRFTKNPLYRGIRYGYLWDRDLGAATRKPEFIAGLKELSRANLSLDTANPSVKMLGDVIRISDQVPDLRVVIDHLPALYEPKEAKDRALFHAHLKELHGRANVYVKLSAVLRMIGDRKVSYELKAHKARLDLLFETFGADRVLYGSDWPNSDPSAPYAAVLKVVQDYFQTKGREAAEKYFWKNSVKAYRWVKRDKSQPNPA